ncbi:MAG: hypothetical protein QN194_16420 [Armatimonadota bacterium]|nr:hypothetical protein [Armatimonadota bacterium]
MTVDELRDGIRLLHELYRDPLFRVRAWEARRRAGDYPGAEAALAGRVTDLLLLLVLWVQRLRPPMWPN